MPTESALLGGDGGDSNSPFGYEEWRPVVGFEGLYSVSSLGRVRSETARKRWAAGRILSGRASPDRLRYARVHLSKNGVIRGEYVHSLVAAAFIGPRPEGHDVNHIDGARANNRRDNLEYVTPSENQRHAYRTGLHAPHHVTKSACIRGHTYTPSNTGLDRNGHRHCRSCQRITRARREAVA